MRTNLEVLATLDMAPSSNEVIGDVMRTRAGSRHADRPGTVGSG